VKTHVSYTMNTVVISSNDKYLLTMLLLLQLMFKVPSTSTHAGLQTSTPLIHCCTHVVIPIAPLFYQSLHQVTTSNTCVLTSRKYACVKWQCSK